MPINIIINTIKQVVELVKDIKKYKKNKDLDKIILPQRNALKSVLTSYYRWLNDEESYNKYLKDKKITWYSSFPHYETSEPEISYIDYENILKVLKKLGIIRDYSKSNIGKYFTNGTSSQLKEQDLKSIFQKIDLGIYDEILLPE